ncbi:hypothetical protein [Lutibacter sp.]|uniref:hypothetical protein n=1 Tax=Lutibacter sp. TaxID=1925666 RepID=UPI0035637A3E
MDGLTFYKSQDGYLIRTKGGVSKSRIMKDPAFKRTRENLSEFGLNAKTGKLIRQSVGVFLNKAKDSKLSSRMLKVMSELKNLDHISVRGERSAGLGLTTNEGKGILKGFDFNIRATLQSVLHSPYTLETATGKIEIQDFNPSEQLSIPDGATHVQLECGMAIIDFETGRFENSFSNTETLAISNLVTTVQLIPESVPTSHGIQIHFLLVEFIQEVNSAFYPLHNGAFNALCIVAVV